MFDSTIVLALLVLTSLASADKILGQDVEIRGASDKLDVEGIGIGGVGGSGGQMRAIYSQRQLSPHRMMHFGKRPTLFSPPSIMSPQQGYDLYERSALPHLQPARFIRPIVVPLQQQQQPEQLRQQDKVPYILSFELENGQALQALPESFEASGVQPPNKNFIYNLEAQQKALRNSKSQDGERLSKLISTGDNSQEDASPSSPSDNNPNQLQDDDSLRAITVNQRSASNVKFPKNLVTSLFYGGQGSSLVSLPIGVYNKKADPKNNLFMHFGK